MATGDEGDAETQPPTPSSSTLPAPGGTPGPPTRPGDDAMLESGDVVGRFRIEAVLGRGGMGVVYRGRDPDLDRALALWSVDQKLGTLFRYDRATGKTEHVRDLSLDDATFITMLAPMPDGSQLLQLARSTDDLVVLE